MSAKHSRPAHKLAPGDILTDNSSPAGTRAFLVLGLSGDEVALLRLFPEPDIADELRKNCIAIEAADLVSQPVPTELLHADITRIIVKDRSLLDMASICTGKLRQVTFRSIRSAVMAADTIAPAVKNKFGSSI